MYKIEIINGKICIVNSDGKTESFNKNLRIIHDSNGSVTRIIKVEVR